MWALAIIDPTIYALPYIIAIHAFVAVFLVLILKFKVLHSFHKKRSLAFYAVMALVVVLLGFLAYDAGLGPTHISYDFVFVSDSFNPEGVNQFNVNSINNGIRTASYNLVLHCINASFTETNPPEYIRVDESTIKMPFTFNTAAEASIRKPVFFTINQGASGFSVNIDMETSEGTNLLVTTCTDSMICTYNSTLNSYTIKSISSVTA